MFRSAALAALGLCSLCKAVTLSFISRREAYPQRFPMYRRYMNRRVFPVYPAYPRFRPYQAVNNYNWGRLHAMQQKSSVDEQRSTVDEVAEARAAKVKESIVHFWNGYKKNAWGGDEIRPLSGLNISGKWGGMGMCMLDTLDTLWIAGLRDEFEAGARWANSLHFVEEGDGDEEKDELHTSAYATRLKHQPNTVSFFETTIRGLGGLLSSYALSQEPIFLEKAEDLGKRLINAFPKRWRGPAWPERRVDISNPTVFHDGVIGNLAEIGTNVLEYTYLSQATGNQFYKDAADTIMKNVMDVSERKGTYLAPMEMNPSALDFGTSSVSLGAGADSYFEYLLKMYIQSGRKDRRPMLVWKKAMEEMKQGAIRKSRDGFMYISSQVMRTNDGSFHPSYTSREMEGLACFVGGMLALGHHLIPPDDREEWWLPYGAEITRTCYEMFHHNPSGLGSETVSFENGTMTPNNAEYNLRPETLESLFYLYRVTGEEKYRDWSWNIMKAINKHLRTKWGYAAAADVQSMPVKLKDSEETFMGAETLKYAYLIHQPTSVIPLDQWVFNTEAHPFPAKNVL